MFLKDIFSGHRNIFLQAHQHTHTQTHIRIQTWACRELFPPPQIPHGRTDYWLGWRERPGTARPPTPPFLSSSTQRERRSKSETDWERKQRLFAVRETTFSTFPAVSGACLCKICSHTVILLLEHCRDTMRMFFTVGKKAEPGTAKQNLQIEKNCKIVISSRGKTVQVVKAS